MKNILLLLRHLFRGVKKYKIERGHPLSNSWILIDEGELEDASHNQATCTVPLHTIPLPGYGNGLQLIK